MSNLDPIMERNFLEYASYVIVDRAIPDVHDGCKPVQRRILQTLYNMDDGKFHKVANVIGDTMKLHPHGDTSIGDALVVLANKEYFIEKQGNFGNIVTGHPAAASRYIECRLTDLARDTLFNKELTVFQDSYDGRRKEPTVLPVKIPVLLMLGVEGIAVGMSTRVLPHNFIELLEAQISILNYDPISIYPDFPTGGLLDVSEYDEGRGKVRIRARLESDGDKRIVIKEIPFSTTTESLIASIEQASQKKKIKISSINDYTTDRVEIEIVLPRGVHTEEVIPQLYAYTNCEVSISSNIVAIKNDHPVVLSVNETLRYLTDKLREQVRAELDLELKKLSNKRHWLTLEQIFIEKRIYKRIEDATTAQQVTREIYDGMAPYAERFVRPLTDEDIEKLLEIRIRRISKYDIKKNRKQLEEVAAAIEETQDKLASLTQTTIGFLKDLIAKYKSAYPRKTRITSFENIEKKDIARQNLKVGYDATTGFFGTEVKESQYHVNMSEYDRILFISKDGSYRIVGAEEKVLIPGQVIYWEPFDQENGVQMTVIYKDTKRIVYAKKIHIHKFIKDREYDLIKDKKGTVEMLLPGDATHRIRVHFAPAKRQRVTEADFSLGELEFTGPASKGRRVAPKPVRRIQKLKDSDTDTTELPPSSPTPSSSPTPPASPPDVDNENDDDDDPTAPSSGTQTSLF